MGRTHRQRGGCHHKSAWSTKLTCPADTFDPLKVRQAAKELSPLCQKKNWSPCARPTLVGPLRPTKVHIEGVSSAYSGGLPGGLPDRPKMSLCGPSGSHKRPNSDYLRLTRVIQKNLTRGGSQGLL